MTSKWGQTIEILNNCNLKSSFLPIYFSWISGNYFSKIWTKKPSMLDTIFTVSFFFGTSFGSCIISTELFLHEKIIILWYYSVSLSTCSFALISLHWLSSSGQSFCCLICWPIWPHSGYLVCPDISSGKSLNCLSNILSILKVISEEHEKSVLNYQWICLY